MTSPSNLSRRLADAASLRKSPAVLAFAISGVAALGSFIAAIILARSAGAAVVGQYALAASTANLVAIFATLGLDRIVMREIAGDLREGKAGQARLTLFTIFRFTAIVATIVGVTYLLLASFTPLSAWLGGDRVAMLAATVGIVALPLLRIGYSALRGANMRSWGQAFEGLPSILFALVLLGLALAGLAVSAGQAAILFFTFQALAALATWLLLRRTASGWGRPEGEVTLALSRVGLPVMAIVFLQTFAEWFILAQVSATMSAGDAGLFRVAYQAIALVLVVITTAEAYVSAPIAGDFRAGRADLAWRRWRRATVLMLVLSAPVLLAAILAPALVLRLIFGAEFEGAALALAIMGVGQGLNVLRGPIGAIIIMSGRDDIQLWLTFAGLALLLLLSFALIPAWGLTGAAIAQAVPVGFRAVLSYVIARRVLPDRRTD